MNNGEWGEFDNTRHRDPVWLTEELARERRGSYERAECCWDTLRYIAELPRERQVGAARMVQMAPARFRLCSYHAQILLDSDPDVKLQEVVSAHDKR